MLANQPLLSSPFQGEGFLRQLTPPLLGKEGLGVVDFTEGLGVGFSPPFGRGRGGPQGLAPKLKGQL